MSSTLAGISSELEQIRAQSLWKTERPILGHQSSRIRVRGGEVLNFCANNYLGLADNPDLVAAAFRRIADEIRVSAEEGIQADFSFHQHGPCLYNHGYGSGFSTDGSAIALTPTGMLTIFPHVYRKLGYDTFRDFTMVGAAATF